jgi:translation initiation factor IF-2
MSKVRVYEVARELGMTNKQLVALFQSLGFSEVRNHMSAVESEVIERIKRKLERRSEPDVVEERINPTVVKRRGKVDRVVRSHAVDAVAAAPVPAAAKSIPRMEPPPSAPSSVVTRRAKRARLALPPRGSHRSWKPSRRPSSLRRR